MFKLYQDKKKEWRWTAKGLNGEPVADSAEGYTTKADAIHGALVAFRSLLAAAAKGQIG